MKELPSVERRCLFVGVATAAQVIGTAKLLPLASVCLAFIIHGRPNWDHVSHALSVSWWRQRHTVCIQSLEFDRKIPGKAT